MRQPIARSRIAALALAACALGAAAPASAQQGQGKAQATAGFSDSPSAHVAASSIAAPDANVSERDATASNGGVPARGRPLITRIVCKTGCLGRQKATPGAVVKFKGEFLDYVEQVVFRGVSGPMPVGLTYKDSIRVRAMVPAGAISSRPYLVDDLGHRSNRAPRKLIIRASAPSGPGVFPVQGPHSYGGAGSRFGAPRNGHTHQGQDISAACGTPLVSVMHATVQYAGYQSAAGNYIVLDNNGTEDDFVYMHLATPAYAKTGGAVGAGQQIGVVGETGDATGCHLHFEYWQGDWYGGGQPIDPLPYLLAWDPSY